MKSVPSPSMNGQRLGDFEIIREVGRGGMGIVYEARQSSLNRKVALKVLSSSLGLTGKAVQRFRLEAEAAARLHHTNIVPVYAIGEHDDVHFYAMELVEGPSVDAVIRQLREARDASSGTTPPASKTEPSGDVALTGPFLEGSFSTGDTTLLTSSSLSSDGHYFDTVAGMVAAVADALDYAHKNGVIHRDMKPSNLLLSPDGRLSINDFGLAKVLEQPGMTMTGEFVGTPAYMSPEQITAGRTPLDHRTDIYSLGATLYELLTLQRPFSGERRDQVLAQIIHKEPISPRKLNRQVPVDLETICLKALEKDPDRRYQSAGKMAEDLRHFGNRFPISARRAGPATRLRKWVRRHPALTASLMVTLAALLAAGFFVYRNHVQEQQLASERQQHEETVLGEKRQSALEKAMACAMGGDFNGAEKALAEAERMNASTGEVRMLRGLMAFHQGHIEEALQHLHQAVALLPESMAARCLLAYSLLQAGNEERYEQVMVEAGRLTPRTPEDFLFKAYAESAAEPQRSLESFQEAFRRRPSVIGYLIRADVLNYLATDLADLIKAQEMAQAAVHDADTAKRLLPGNATALIASLNAHVTAASIYSALQQPSKQQASLKLAEEEANSLKDHFSNPLALGAVWIMLREEGKEGVALEQLGPWIERTSNVDVCVCYAMVLYERKDFVGSLRSLDKTKGNPLSEEFRPIVLAEIDGTTTRALAALKDNEKLELDGWNRLNALMYLRLLGHLDESQRLALELINKPERFPLIGREGYLKLLDYAAGKLSADQLVLKTADSRHARCFACYYQAITYLSQGERTKALEQLRAAIATRALTQRAYWMSRAFVTRLQMDPTWPSWIPMKK